MTTKLTQAEFRQLIRECITRIASELNENRVVTFNGKTYPLNGWCVFLGGGSGSGKGSALNMNVPIDGKVINVDKWQKIYARMNGIDYDSHDKEQVAQIYKGINRKDWKNRYRENFFNPEARADKDNLPNVIFDMTAKNPYGELVPIAKQAHELGYQTMLVWVVSTRHEAILRNIKRGRNVPDSVLHSIHNDIMDNMPRFLRGSYAGNCLDDVWIIFSSAESIDHGDLEGDEKKTAAVRLEHEGNGFVIDKETMNRLVCYLGEKEANPDNPQTYLSSKEIVDRFGGYKNDKGGYDFDRSKFDIDRKLYR